MLANQLHEIIIPCCALDIMAITGPNQAKTRREEFHSDHSHVWQSSQHLSRRQESLARPLGRGPSRVPFQGVLAESWVFTGIHWNVGATGRGFAC